MPIFLFILVAGLTLIYLNVSPVLPGKKGKLLALGVLLAIFFGMMFRDTLVGCTAVAFTSVWLCQALLMYIPWGLFRIVRRIVIRRALKPETVTRVCRILLAATLGLTLAIIGYGVPHNANYRIHETTVKLPAFYADGMLSAQLNPELSAQLMTEPQGIAVDSAANLPAGNNLEVDSATLKNPADSLAETAPRSAGFTAVFFSDIHVDPLFSRAKIERMIADVDSIKPDYLLFGGDIADVSSDQLDEWGYDTLFKQLTSRAKIAAVAINGNHESMQERNGSDPGAWMHKVGFVVLDDSTACIGPACFTGRTDFQVARSRGVERKPLVNLFPRTFSLPWILMDHQPKGIESDFVGQLPNYALSGHTHNGQFFPGTVVINFVWRLAFGEGVLDGVPWLVSAGVDCWGPPVRVGSDADMWVIRFETAR